MSELEGFMLPLQTSPHEEGGWDKAIVAFSLWRGNMSTREASWVRYYLATRYARARAHFGGCVTVICILVAYLGTLSWFRKDFPAEFICGSGDGV